MIRVLLADDHEIIRRNIRTILERHPAIQVVAEATNGRMAIELANLLRPDVALVDIRMPAMDGLEVTEALAGPGTANPVAVVILTTFDLDEYVYGALRRGACGFLLKRSGPALLVEAVRAAHTGEALISPSITSRLLRELIGQQPPTKPPTKPPAKPPAEPLTEREHDIAHLVAQGLTNAEVGGELFISAGTAKTHIANIQRKLGVRNRVGIAIWAKENGLA